MRLLDCEQVRNIAMGIDLFEAPAGRRDVPAERALAQVAARCEMQALHAVLDRAVVAVAGLVPDVHLHVYASAGGTRKSDAIRVPRSCSLSKNCFKNCGRPPAVISSMRAKCSMACISPARRSVSADCSLATDFKLL